jgi:serine/threonine protein kinase
MLRFPLVCTGEDWMRERKKEGTVRTESGGVITFSPFSLSLPAPRSTTVVVGSYELLRKIGEGDNGKVFLCRHLISRKQYAMKIVRECQHWYSCGRLTMNPEVEILSKLKHPNIIKLYDAIWREKKTHIVEELVKGVTLEQFLNLRRSSFNSNKETKNNNHNDIYNHKTNNNFKRQNRKALLEIEMKRIFFQILDAVAYLHENGVVHGDLLASNIMVLEEEDTITVKLCDFGSAIYVPSSDSAHQPTTNATSTRRRSISTTSSLNRITKDDSSELNNISSCSAFDSLKAKDISQCGFLLYQLIYGTASSVQSSSLLGSANGWTDPLALGDRRIGCVEAKEETKEVSKATEKFVLRFVNMPPLIKSLFRGLVSIDSTSCLSAKEALAHPWLANCMPVVPLDKVQTMQQQRPFHNNEELPLFWLPLEMIYEICNHLDQASLCSFSLACKSVYAATQALLSRRTDPLSKTNTNEVFEKVKQAMELRLSVAQKHNSNLDDGDDDHIDNYNNNNNNNPDYEAHNNNNGLEIWKTLEDFTSFPVYNANTVASVVEDDKEFLLEILVCCEKSFEEQTKNMRKALSDRNWYRLWLAVRDLKGCSQTIGLDKLTVFYKNLMNIAKTLDEKQKEWNTNKQKQQMMVPNTVAGTPENKTQEENIFYTERDVELVEAMVDIGESLWIEVQMQWRALSEDMSVAYEQQQRMEEERKRKEQKSQCTRIHCH